MRSAEFDREQVLRSAIQTFMAKGFTKASMKDLKEATGLHPGSIYSAFENKQGLLMESLKQYHLDRNKDFSEIFDNQSTVLDGFKTYMNYLIEECEGDYGKECLLQRTLNELTDQDDDIKQLIRENLASWRQGFEDKLLEAQENHELSSQKNIKELAEFLVMGIYGIRTYSHTQYEKGVLQRLSHSLLSHIFN